MFKWLIVHLIYEYPLKRAKKWVEMDIMKKVTQKDEVLKYLQCHEYITSMIAFKRFNITRLSAVVFGLRKQGHDIHMKMKKGKNSYYGVYSLHD